MHPLKITPAAEKIMIPADRCTRAGRQGREVRSNGGEQKTTRTGTEHRKAPSKRSMIKKGERNLLLRPCPAWRATLIIITLSLLAAWGNPHKPYKENMIPINKQTLIPDWSQAFLQSTGSIREPTGLSLLTLVLHDSLLYAKHEWKQQETWQLQSVVGEQINTGCQMVNESDHTNANAISVSMGQEDEQIADCTYPTARDCWKNFTLTHTAEVVCLWSDGTQGLSFKFIIDTKTPSTTAEPHNTTTQPTPPVILTPKIFKIRPYIIRKTSQQQILFNPAWSLKQVELLMQTNVSDIQPACSLFLQTSFEGWTTQLRKRSSFTTRKLKDVTSVIGTGLGILNSIDSEVLMSKLAATTRDLSKLQQPLKSSLLALETHQWMLSNTLPN